MIFLFSINIKSFGLGDLVDGVYQIENKDDLIEFAKIVNGEHDSIGQNISANAILKNNIEFNTSADDQAKLQAWKTWVKDGSDENQKPENEPSEKWTPIGSESKPYTGTFDGNGKTISGLYCKTNSDACLFSALGIQYIDLDQNKGIEYQGKVENLGIKNSYICGSGNVGVVGKNGSIITRCYIENCVLKGESGSYLGGIAGWCIGTEAIVENSYSADCTLTADGLCGGGLVGYCYNSGTVKNSYSTNDVGGSGSYKNILIGYNASVVTNCYYLAGEQGTPGNITAVTEDQFKGEAMISGGTYDGETVLEALNDGAGGEVFKQNEELATGSHRYLLLSWENTQDVFTPVETAKNFKIPVRVKINYDPSNKLEAWVKDHITHEFFRKTQEADAQWESITLGEGVNLVSNNPVNNSIKIGVDGTKTQDFIFEYQITYSKYKKNSDPEQEYQFGFDREYKNVKDDSSNYGMSDGNAFMTYIKQDVGGGKKLFIDYDIDPKQILKNYEDYQAN